MNVQRRLIIKMTLPAFKFNDKILVGTNRNESIKLNANCGLDIDIEFIN